MGKKPVLGQCGQCDGCLQEDCSQCIQCLDMKKFGGPGKKKKACKHRKLFWQQIHKGSSISYYSIIKTKE